jgi:hypothetical protein
MVVSAGADKDIEPNNATETMYLNFMDSGGLSDPDDQLGKTTRKLTAFILLGTVGRVKFLSGDRRAFFLARSPATRNCGPVRACRISEI